MFFLILYLITYLISLIRIDTFIIILDVTTQIDEVFPEAWHFDAASVYGNDAFNIQSKVYISPKLLYLKVNVIETQDVLPNNRNYLPKVFVKLRL